MMGCPWNWGKPRKKIKTCIGCILVLAMFLEFSYKVFVCNNTQVYSVKIPYTKGFKTK